MAAVYEDDGDFDFVVDEEEDVDFIVSLVPAKTKKQSATTNAGKGAAKGGKKKSAAGRKVLGEKTNKVDAEIDDDGDDDGAGAAHGDGKSIEDTYQKLSQLEHILLRPDTYVGSIERQNQQVWVLKDDAACDSGDGDSAPLGFAYKNIEFVPGLYKIFDEILVNACDHSVRDKTMDALRVDFDEEEGTVRVYNNGKGIPVEMHKGEGVHVPELIFGHLLTSSNYDDGEKKLTGGRNGYGS